MVVKDITIATMRLKKEMKNQSQKLIMTVLVSHKKFRRIKTVLSPTTQEDAKNSCKLFYFILIYIKMKKFNIFINAADNLFPVIFKVCNCTQHKNHCRKKRITFKNMLHLW